MLTDHQTLQSLRKRNSAHKQYSARLARWLHRLSHFDVNVQNTAGKNIPFTEYRSHPPIIYICESEAENETNRREETESEEEFVINQKYDLFDFEYYATHRAGSTVTTNRPITARRSHARTKSEQLLTWNFTN